MDEISHALEMWSEKLKQTREQIEELENWFCEESTRKSSKEFDRKEKAFTKSLPMIKRTKKKKKFNKCPICLEDMMPGVIKRYRTRSSYNQRTAETVDCLHKFHLACLEEWLKNSLTCPVCRRNVSVEGGIDIGEC